MFTAWLSFVPGVAAHELAGLVPGGIVPGHVTCTVWPGAVGTTTSCEAGLEASAGSKTIVVPVNAITPMIAPRTVLLRLIRILPEPDSCRHRSTAVLVGFSREGSRFGRMTSRPATLGQLRESGWQS